jgi:hypothetical protein
VSRSKKLVPREEFSAGTYWPEEKGGKGRGEREYVNWFAVVQCVE